mmetsp:Transcript_92659/g.160371  ORF Transcript_92659/g.160371 Transcript_92659/m.160371 type:complete len:152 (-) Transcript_92659:25-480(-)
MNYQAHPLNTSAPCSAKENASLGHLHQAPPLATCRTPRAPGRGPRGALRGAAAFACVAVSSATAWAFRQHAWKSSRLSLSRRSRPRADNGSGLRQRIGRSSARPRLLKRPLRGSRLGVLGDAGAWGEAGRGSVLQGVNRGSSKMTKLGESA